MKRVGADPAKIKVEGLKLNVTTEEPFVKQFIPVQATSVKAHVTIRYENNKPIELDLDESFGVEKANIFSAVAAFRRVELAALAIALIAAITTGMQSQQYQDAINGSLSTYWFLFAWGFATDQIKNVLEHIGTLSSTE
jgi:uncharacterized membrane protein